MDSGRPFRITRPEDGRGRTPARPAASRTPEPVPVNEKSSVPTATVEPVEAVVSERTKAKPAGRKRSAKKLRAVLVVLGIIIVAGGGIFFIRPLLAGTSSLPGADEYQAVTLVDGQIYFGKVKSVGSDYIEIDNGYYLQPTVAASSENGQPDTGKLVKLSNRLYSPAGNIVIPIRQVISFEALDPDGQIVQMMGKEQ